MTPDFVAADNICRRLSIPDNLGLVSAVGGALSLLGDEWNWQQSGDMTPAECAEVMRIMLLEWYSGSCGDDEGTPAPYWDNPEDVDDEEPPDEQPWYGKMEGLTFVEELGIWAITGFIAYSGDLGAAIAFKTFAPKFALAWKQGGVAAAVRVFIDGVDTGALVIGSGDGIVEKDFMGDPALEEHDILIVYEGEA